MRKIAYSMIAMAMAAFTLTSCEDVPAPFGQPEDPGSGGGGTVVIEPTGSGTEADPYNVAAAIEKCKEIGDETPTASSPKYYVKGIVTTAGEADASYGNATFVISDDENGTNKFTAFQVLGFNGAKMPAGYSIPVGAEVVIYGPIYNYKGNTPETGGKGMAYIYSINGEGGGDQPSGETIGTKDDPIKASEALTKINALADGEKSTSKAYVKGKIVKVTTSQENFEKYGNINYWISDDGTEANQVQVYAGDGLNGEKFKSVNDIAAGDEVVVFGTLYKYVNKNSGAVTPEIEGSYLVSLVKGQGGGGDTPSGDGDGTEANPYSVSAAIAKADQAGVFVKAYIVGWIEGQVYNTGAHFNGSSTVATNILIAESANETDPAKCMPVQLPSGAVRSGVNLVDNPDNYKKEILLYGDITKYFGTAGLKNTKYAKIGTTEVGTKPEGGDTPTPSGGEGADGSKIVSIADFNAASESDNVWYQLTGTVKNLKDGDQYGNFDLEDASGSVYVYGVLSEKGGAKKKFQDLVSKYGIKNGTKITIVGTRGSFQGKIEVMNAYFIRVESDGGQGGGSSTGADGSTVISVANFNAAAESNDVWYQLTGTIKNLKDGDQYGNFDLEDNTGSVYVYGVLSEKGGAKKKFQDLVSKYGIKNGSVITIVGNRGSFQGKIEVMNAYFIKVTN
ncbi:MAG: hypothetical protein J6I31_08125 [Prevotella sp.]|nr:hypothetical protein [Prevotella sp.]